MSISPISPEINETIQRDLQAIEEKHNVRILYACESGSRAWGFESPDSDYDVRFIYAHPVDWYLTIDEATGLNQPQRDVIEVPIAYNLDYVGFDLRKALRMTYAYNATISEWLQSPIVYRDVAFTDKMRKLLDHCYRIDKTWYHHRSLADKLYRRHLDKAYVRHKRYFYALRSVLTMQWVEKYPGQRPPIEFERLLNDIVPYSDTTIRPLIADLLQRKRNGGELAEGPAIEELDSYILTQLGEHPCQPDQGHSPDLNLRGLLDDFFLKTIRSE